MKWVSDDGSASVQSVQNEPTYNKTDWVENGTHQIAAANGDSYNATFYYESHHKLLPDGVTYYAGEY